MAITIISPENVVTALETMKAEELTMEFVKGRPLDCEIKMKLNAATEGRSEKTFEEHPTVMVGYKNKVITCYLCGGKGHYQSDWPNNRRVKSCSCNSNRNPVRNYDANFVEKPDDDSDRDF